MALHLYPRAVVNDAELHATVMGSSPLPEAAQSLIDLANNRGGQVVVGFHWPSDILASAVLGGISVRGVDRLSTRLAPLLNLVARGYDRKL